MSNLNFSEVDLAMLNALDVRKQRIIEAKGNPDEALTIIKEVMKDERVRLAFSLECLRLSLKKKKLSFIIFCPH